MCQPPSQLVNVQGSHLQGAPLTINEFTSSPIHSLSPETEHTHETLGSEICPCQKLKIMPDSTGATKVSSLDDVESIVWHLPFQVS